MASEIILRDYQKAGVDRIAGEFRKGHDKVLFVSPTGSGKTTVASETVLRTVNRGKRVLFLAHRRRLIQQIAERAAMFGIPYGIEMADLPSDGWVVRDPSAPLIIASRDTLLSRAMRNGWTGLPMCDLLVVDEAHNLEAPAYEALANACKIKYRIGLTASPCKSDGSGLGKRNWDSIVESATVPDLIRQGHLVPVKCFAPPEIGELRKKGQSVGIAGDPVDHWKRYGEERPTIVFARTVAEAIAVRDRYRLAGVRAEHVDANTPYEERERTVAGLKSGRVQVATNVNVWTEGVDIPELAVCQLLCKCGSLVRFLQAVGRIMRPAPGKPYGILLDHSGAVFEHGFPDEPADWSLAEDDDIHARNKKDRDEGKRKSPTVCRNCGCLFAGAPNCPECGTPTPRGERKGEKPNLDRERLVQVNDGERETRAQFIDRAQRFWIRTLYQGAAKNWKFKVANMIFKNKFGQWPEQMGLNPSFGMDYRERFITDLCPQFARKNNDSF